MNRQDSSLLLSVAPDTARRDFLRKSSQAALSLAVAGVALPNLASAATTIAPPVRTRGATVLNVMNFGAMADGVHDDTAAIQRAINALPADGGTVFVPAGTYLIDATKNVRLRSFMHFQLDMEARLVAKPNAADRSYVVNAYKVTDVEISGGQVVGERDQHLGTTGEWGHCVMVRGSKRVTVRDMRMSKGWGDGLSIGAADGAVTVLSEDVVVSNVVCTQNRRQALTIGRCKNVKVYDSEFSYTGGIKPSCGIDIEPDPVGTSLTYNIRIENCWVHNNASNGIQIYKDVNTVVIKGCVIERNQGYGVLALQGRNAYIVNNEIKHNRLYGVGLRTNTDNYKVYSNVFRNNKTLYFGLTSGTGRTATVTGTSTSTNPKTTWHLEITSDCTRIYVGKNVYYQ